MRTLADRIGAVKRELVRSKPRSLRRIELQARLRDLVTRQLRRELRNEKRAA
jgi:hypothetical protein